MFASAVMTLGGTLTAAYIEASLLLFFSDKNLQPYVEHLGLEAA